MKKNVLCLFLLMTFITVLPGLSTADDNLRDTILELDYTPIKMDIPPCSSKIAVVKFTETSPIKDVGQSNLFRYIPSTDIGTWMGKAVYEQLKSQGFDVEYFKTMDDAGDLFIITGVANKVYINRPGQLDMKYKVQLDGMVTRQNKLLYAMNYTSKQEKDLINTGDNAGKLMAGLHDTLGIFLPEAIKAINENK